MAISRRRLLIGAGVGIGSLYLRPGMAWATGGNVTNLLPNPKCASGLSGWSGDVGSGPAALLTRVTSDGVSPGSTSAELSVATAGATCSMYAGLDTTGYKITCSYDDIIFIRAAVKVTELPSGASIQLLARYGGISANDDPLMTITDPPVDEWFWMEGCSVAGWPATSGTGSLDVFAQASVLNASGSAVSFQMTNVMVVANPGCYVDYFDGDGGSSADSGSGFGWTGTANASTSYATLPTTSEVPEGFIFGMNDNSQWDAIPTTATLSYHETVKSQVRRLTFTLDNNTVDSDGNFVWTSSEAAAYDAINSAFKAAGVKLILIPVGTPTALAGGGSGGNVPPSDLDGWANLCGQLAARYADNLAAIEIWNEPNYSTSWGAAPDPTTYVELLQKSYAAVKDQASDVPVALGGIGGYAQTSISGTTTNVTDWMNALYAAEAKGNYDIVSLHPYMYARCTGQSSQLAIDDALAAMAANDDDAPLWLTELGFTDASASGSTFVVSSTMQEVLMRLTYGMLKRRSYVDAILPYRIMGEANSALLPSTPDTYDDGFAWVLWHSFLGTVSYTNQPAWSAMVAELDGQSTS